ncbi:hypothetical protein D3C77_569550 [compost metagenome]
MLFVKAKHFDFLDPGISASVTEEEERFVIRLESKAFAQFVSLDLKGADARWSDNVFDLSAGRPVSVVVGKDSLSEPLSLEAFREQLTVMSLFDTFE